MCEKCKYSNTLCEACQKKQEITLGLIEDVKTLVLSKKVKTDTINYLKNDYQVHTI